MMRKFFVHLYSVLTTDAALNAVIPPDHIGASVRQNTRWPCLEYGIDGNPLLDPDGKMIFNVVFQIYSLKGADECWMAEERLHPLLDPRKLTVNAEGFAVSRMRRVDATGMPDLFSDWRYRLTLEYLTHIVVTSPTHSNQ